MQTTFVAALILCCLQAAVAQTSNRGSSLRGSEATRSLKAFSPSVDSTQNAFWNAYPGKTSYYEEPKRTEAKLRIGQKWAEIKQAVSDAGITDAKEFAMFMANVMQESGQLTTVKEETDHYGDADYDWGVCESVDVKDEGMDYCRDWQGEIIEDDLTKCCKGKNCKVKGKCTKHYTGRGYLQTSHYINYKDAKEDGKCTKGGKVDIVADPEEVVNDDSLAWCTAAHFWRKNIHDSKRCEDGCDMGNTIHAINGDLECGEDSTMKAQARKRFCMFKQFYEAYKEQKLPTWWADKVCLSNLDALCPVR